MLVTAFAVILATVVLQGTTLGLVIRAADLRDLDPAPPLDLAAAEAAMARSQLKVVENRAHDSDGSLRHPRLLESYRLRASQTAKASEQAEATAQAIAAHFDIVLAAVAAGREELVRLHRNGDISDETLHDLERDLDLEELAALAARAT